jgi:putative tricarboxylic transport membrane protein
MSKSDNAANLAVIALGIFVTYYSYYSLKLGLLITPGAGFLPFLCGLALVALGIIWRLQTILFKSPSQAEPAGDPLAAVCEAEPASRPRSRAKLVLAFAATVVYAVLFERIGFLLATLVFMLGWQAVVERQRWPKAIIITVLCAVAMYALFRWLLHVELPPNPLLS